MIIDIQGLVHTFPQAKAPALRLDRFALKAGEACFVSGPSGCGKSTLLGLLAGIHTPQQGRVAVLGHDMALLQGPARDRLRGVSMGVIFQQFNLLPYLSAMDNIVLPAGWHPERLASAGGSMGAARRQAAVLLEALGLESSAWTRPARQLSVGQQQRVAAARALLGRPALVLADEPTSALDEDSRDAFMDILMSTARRAGSAPALVMVSHDARLAKHFDQHLSLVPVALREGHHA